MAYYLTLPQEFMGLHDIVHVSMLKRYHSDHSHIILQDEMQVQVDMTYEEFFVDILGWTDKVWRNKMIPMVKVQHHIPKKATWELESETREKFLDLFETNLGTKIF